MKLLLVVNPISGGVNKEPFLTKANSLLEKYRIDYQIFKTTGKNDKEQLKELVTSYQPDKVASVRVMALPYLQQLHFSTQNIPMGIIPLGSANGMAAELFVNLDPIEALKDILMSHLIGDLDMVLVNDKYHSMHIGDVGINAKIVQSYDKDKNRGMTTYAKYFIEELNTVQPFKVKVEANGKTITENCVMIALCNSRKFGTGVPLNLHGNPMDGKFELVILKNLNTELLIKAGLSKFYDAFHDSQNAEVISTNQARVLFEKSSLLQLDGEVIGTFKELDVKMIKGAVKLITTTANKCLT